MAGEALDIFISYSRRDEALKDELVNYHLKLLQREGKIRTWQDRDIEAGAEWAEEIKANLEKADIILLLITRHFLASDYCYETEMQRAVQRHYDGTTTVIPIILETCGWQYSNFSQLQVLPKDGKPVTRWEDKAEAFFDVEEGIRRVVDNLNAKRRQAAEKAQAEAERQRQQAAERQRQQQVEAEHQAREQIAAEQRQREAAERLKQVYEAELLQQQDAGRQAREAAERQRQQQTEVSKQERKREEQLIEECQHETAARGQPVPTGMGRRRALQVIGLGGGSLIVAIASTSLLQNRRVQHPKPLEPSPSASSANLEAPAGDASPAPGWETVAAAPSGLPVLEGKATVELMVNGSSIVMELDGANAPITAGNFVDLVNRGVYDGLMFHRVVKEPQPFVTQGGDPQGKDPNVPAQQLGTGSFIDPDSQAPRYIPLEIKPAGATQPIYSQTFEEARITASPELPHTRGAVAMARSQAVDSASAQFYITLAELPFLDGSYAVFGYVTSGMETVDAIQQGDRIETARVISGLENLKTD